MRVLGGEDYIEYINNILTNKQEKVRDFSAYELYIFDNLYEMYEAIKKKDKKYGLSRMVAGYAWEWKSKKNPKDYDIVIDGEKLRWNSTQKNWINSENALNEVGCIHTTQGYDINYAGVIIGNDIVYRDNTIKINKDNYYDRNGKRTVSDESELKGYIINIYKTLLTRGIRGTYIYICDNELRDYFKKYINTYKMLPDNIEKDIIEKDIIKE